MWRRRHKHPQLHFKKKWSGPRCHTEESQPIWHIPLLLAWGSVGKSTNSGVVKKKKKRERPEVCYMDPWYQSYPQTWLDIYHGLQIGPTNLPRYKLFLQSCSLGVFTSIFRYSRRLLIRWCLISRFCAVQWLMFRRFGGPHGLRFHGD